MSYQRIPRLIVLGFVIYYREKTGISPTYAEIGTHFGVSRSAAWNAVSWLNAPSRMYIINPGVARSLQPTEAGASAWAAYQRNNPEAREWAETGKKPEKSQV